jgi:rubrerythrin
MISVAEAVEIAREATRTGDAATCRHCGWPTSDADAGTCPACGTRTGEDPT